MQDPKLKLQAFVREIIKDELQSRRAKNPKYSLRSYANFLGIDSALLGKFLREERNLGVRSLLRIEKKITSIEGKRLLISHLNPREVEDDVIVLKDSPFERWYELPLWEICKTLRHKHELLKVSKQLLINETELEQFLAKMTHAGLLKEIDTDQFIPTCSDIRIVDARANKNILQWHQKLVELSLRSISQYDQNLRSNSGMTFLMNANEVPNLKREILLFRKRIKTLAKRKKPYNGAFQFQFSLFPLALW